MCSWVFEGNEFVKSVLVGTNIAIKTGDFKDLLFEI